MRQRLMLAEVGTRIREEGCLRGRKPGEGKCDAGADRRSLPFQPFHRPVVVASAFR